ncbi:hypothetical protein [Stappia indica]|uniref:hypothetical protein n=1 Tax=Stappia indica TaxID=538381 RepID=UPI001CD43D25|nr:hypothetical protein [Stappia indica]MCA1298018.1 hypothetical protein [Stappia indica]
MKRETEREFNARLSAMIGAYWMKRGAKVETVLDHNAQPTGDMGRRGWSYLGIRSDMVNGLPAGRTDMGWTA